MAKEQPAGCLAAILRIFGIGVGQPKITDSRAQYRLRDDFLSAAEMSFFQVLATALKGRFNVCCKVRLGDLFFPVGNKQSLRNKIERKHVDFLLCDPITMLPVCGVELDDSSHARTDRQARDQFVDLVFQEAGLPLVRFVAKRGYRAEELINRLAPHLSPVSHKALVVTASPGETVPTCPKCDLPMVQRTASQGRYAGKRFYGCVNYPRCKQRIDI